MAWCRKANVHYPDQCYPRSMSPHGVNKWHRVNWNTFLKSNRSVTIDLNPLNYGKTDIDHINHRLLKTKQTKLKINWQNCGSTQMSVTWSRALTCIFNRIIHNFIQYRNVLHDPETMAWRLEYQTIYARIWFWQSFPKLRKTAKLILDWAHKQLVTTLQISI